MQPKIAPPERRRGGSHSRSLAAHWGEIATPVDIDSRKIPTQNREIFARFSAATLVLSRGYLHVRGSRLHIRQHRTAFGALIRGDSGNRLAPIVARDDSASDYLLISRKTPRNHSIHLAVRDVDPSIPERAQIW